LAIKEDPVDLFEKCRLYDRTKEAEAAGYYAYFIPMQSESGPEVTINGRRVIMLGSNNYMGLTQHPHVREMAMKALEKYGPSCTGSRLMNGTLEMHLELERRLAKFAKKDAALVFTTGYQVNLGTISALAGRHDTVIIDKADHASIVDGCKLSGAKVVRFKHGDLADLERVLQQADQKHGILIVMDGVFSMEGDLADLPGIVKLKKKYNARLLVDEAHSVGVFGEGGRGTCEHFGVIPDVDLIMGTFSKSFASTGGYIAGDADVIYYIKHAARPFLFTAAIPPSSAAAALGALDVIESEPERRVQLWKNVHFMKKGLDDLGFDTGNSKSPVIPIAVGEDMRNVQFWRRLLDLGVFANAAVSPAVEPGHALIRSSYMATHNEEVLGRALGIFQQAGKDLGLI
jgi:8-amino-7-oxononanoate synthase